MGSASSKGKNYQETSKYGQIFIQTDKQLYHPGDTVTGKIHLNLKEPFPGTKLCLKLKGKQQISYLTVVPDKQGKVSGDLVTETKHPISQIANVHTWNNEVSVGQYTIPFSFLLPIGLPNSFSQSGAKFSSSIVYKVEAFLQPTIEKNPKLKHKQPFIIREASAPELFQPNSKELNQPIFGGCLGWYKKGSVRVKVQNVKTAYTTGEFVKVDLDLDNSQSQMKCERIIFLLKQRLILKANNSVFYHEITLNQKEFPSINAGAPGQKLAFEFKLPLENKQLAKKTLVSKEDLLQQTDSPNSVGSVCTSTDLTSIFLLEVLCLMEGYVYNLMNALKFEFPVQVLHPELESEKVAAPNNWNPQLIKTFTTTFSYAPSEGGKNLMMMNSASVHPK